MRLGRLWLGDYRSHESLELTLSEGLTAILGANGQGKTNLVEAIGWLATTASFRGAPTDALIRSGADQAVIRAEVHDDQRTQLVEAELKRSGRTRVLVNRQPLRRSRDLLGILRTTVFSPDDLDLIKGAPGGRRGFVDETLVAVHPKYDQHRRDLDRVLRQRAALLRSSGGRLAGDAAFTLDVWDQKLVEAGERLAAARMSLIERLAPLVAERYRSVAGASAVVSLAYVAPWREQGLAAALLDARGDDLRRGVTTVGPHRDDLAVTLDDLASRTHASQGEQRSLALALRLAAHQLVTDETGTAPVLLLDDVFSELDPERARSLVETLPPGQSLLTSANELPPGAVPDAVYRLSDGVVRPDGLVG